MQEELAKKLHAAEKAYEAKALDDAEDIIADVLAKNPTEPSALRLSGLIHMDRGRLQQAAILMRSSIQQDCCNPLPFLDLGRILMLVGRNEEAADFIKESLKLNQYMPGAWLLLGECLRFAGQKEKAIMAYQNVVGLDASSAAAYFGLGLIYESERNFDNAIACYSKAIEIKPDCFEAHFNLGLLLQELQCVREAIACYRKAIEIKPDLSDAYYKLATAEEQAGLEVDAIHHYADNLRLRRQPFLVMNKANVNDLSAACTSSFFGFGQGLHECYELTPSYQGHSFSPDWARLWHVHIPKTGGMRFYNPLKHLLDELQNVPLPIATSCFHVSRCSSPLESEAYVRVLSEIQVDIQSCLVNSFSVSQDLLWDSLCNRLPSSPIRIAFYRDPVKRLSSALKYLYRINGCNLNMVIEAIQSGHLHLDNVITRALAGAFDRCLCDNDLARALSKDRVDYLLPLGDFGLGITIQSAFLSANDLPNIVAPKVVNSTTAEFAPSNAEMEALLDLAQERGLNYWDERLAVNIKLDNLDFDIPGEHLALNPWTMIYRSWVREKLSERFVFVKTDDFLKDPSRWLDSDS